MALPVWIEIHFDDEVLKDDPKRQPEAKALMLSLADVADSKGAKLCFRMRETFCQGARGTKLFRQLMDRGHELGVHAHGKRLPEASAAFEEAGGQTVVAVPGLVQLGAAGRAPMLRQVAGLGYRLVTDLGVERAWAYEGLLPRWEEGIVVMAPSVAPFDWGLMDRDGTRHGVSAEAFAALRTLEDRAAGFGAAYFGAAMHEHDFCGPGSLTPRPETLRALADYLSDRVVTAGSVPRPERPAELEAVRRRSDREVRFARAVNMATGVVRRRVARHKGWRLPDAGGMALPVGQRHVVLERHGRDDAEAVVVVSHSGHNGGRSDKLSPFGLGLTTLTSRLWAVYLYDRAGTGRSAAAGSLAPGNRAHTEDFSAVLAYARGEGLPVVALSFSAGLLPVLGAARRGDRPDAVVDVEAPVDRWSLVQAAQDVFAHKDLWDPWQWAGLEAVELVGGLGVPFARVQGEVDHVHGRMHEHHRRMVEAARGAGLAVHDSGVLPGHVHGHAEAMIAALDWARELAGRAGDGDG